MTYGEIKTKHSNAYNEIMERAGVFWAFSNEQFEKGLKKVRESGKLSEGEKVARIPGGGFCPSKNIDKMLAEMKEADKTRAKELKEMRELKEKAILYELNNHECFYRGEGLDTVAEIFKGIYTKEDILKVYNKNLWSESRQRVEHAND